MNTLLKQFKENEALNLHTENAVMLAIALGTKREAETVRRIAERHASLGYLPYEDRRIRDKIVNRLLPKITEGATQPAQYTGHGANTGGLQAHSIGESYPYLVVGIDNPRQGKETRWRVVNAITGEATFYDFLRVDKAHAVAERAAAGCAVALSLFR